MSDVIFGRLRALLGTTGVERDPQGVPRATPDSPDALSLVCRLAHEEGWKIRVEGRATWLAPDAPADLLVVDLTADVAERLGAVREASVPTLGFYSHVEQDVRRAAEEAGIDRVVPRSRMAREGPALVEQLLAA